MFYRMYPGQSISEIVFWASLVSDRPLLSNETWRHQCCLLKYIAKTITSRTSSYLHHIRYPDYLHACLQTISRPGQSRPRSDRRWSAPPCPSAPSLQSRFLPWKDFFWEMPMQRKRRARHQKKQTVREVILTIITITIKRLSPSPSPLSSPWRRGL